MQATFLIKNGYCITKEQIAFFGIKTFSVLISKAKTYLVYFLIMSMDKYFWKDKIWLYWPPRFCWQSPLSLKSEYESRGEVSYFLLQHIPLLTTEREILTKACDWKSTSEWHAQHTFKKNIINIYVTVQKYLLYPFHHVRNPEERKKPICFTSKKSLNVLISSWSFWICCSFKSYSFVRSLV